MMRRASLLALRSARRAASSSPLAAGRTSNFGTLAAVAGGSTALAVACSSDYAAECSGVACSLLGTEVKKLALMKEMDKDGDGKLSEVEVKAMFSKLDKNKDGEITFEV